MPISVNHDSSADEVTLMLGKNFDFNCVDEFRRAYENVEIEDKTSFVVDLRRTQYMDSSALGMLINMHKLWAGNNRIIKIINANVQIRKIFTISRFDKKFKIV